MTETILAAVEIDRSVSGGAVNKADVWNKPFADDEFFGQVCLVTGAAQGIGAAIAARLAGHGATVAVTDINEKGAEAKAAELRAGGHAASAFALDVRDTERIESVVGEVQRTLGPIQVLVNNAGLFRLTQSTAVPDEEWQLQIDVMLTGPFKLTRRVAWDMLDRKSGSIVNVCSIGGFGGHPQRTAYNAAKGGTKVMTEVLATEWASRGIRVNAVAPAVTRTEILTGVIESAGGQIKVDEFASRTPLGRIAETEEIADSVVFLASPRASYITGETLVVDGGWLASDGFPRDGGTGGEAGFSGSHMSADSVSAVIVAQDHPFVDAFIDSIGTDVVHADPEQLDIPLSDQGLTMVADRLVWIHVVPAASLVTDGDPPTFHESELLVRSAKAARRAAAAARTTLTFIALLPSRGFFTGSAGLACDLARGAMESVIRTQIGPWSENGGRIVGVVYAGLEGHTLDRQRPHEELRRRTPIGTLGTVDQLADTVRYLGSPNAAYVTGTLVHVDGGWNAYSWIYPARTL